MKATSLKDWKKVCRRIKHVRGVDEHEKILYARSLAATPDERWRMNETHLRTFGLWGRSALKTFVSNQRTAQVKSKSPDGCPTWI